jgi:hypothetical protein
MKLCLKFYLVSELSGELSDTNFWFLIQEIWDGPNNLLLITFQMRLMHHIENNCSRYGGTRKHQAHLMSVLFTVSCSIVVFNTKLKSLQSFE